MKNKPSDLQNLHNDTGGLLYGKHHFSGALHAVFATVNAAHAWQHGLGANRRYFHIEDQDGNVVLVRDDRQPGHAYAVLEALDRVEGD